MVPRLLARRLHLPAHVSASDCGRFSRCSNCHPLTPGLHCRSQAMLEVVAFAQCTLDSDAPTRADSLVLCCRRRPVHSYGTGINGDAPEHQRLEPPVLILTSPQPRTLVSRGIAQRLLRDKPDAADRAHDCGGSHGLLLPSMTDDTPGEVYVLKE